MTLSEARAAVTRAEIETFNALWIDAICCDPLHQKVFAGATAIDRHLLASKILDRGDVGILLDDDIFGTGCHLLVGKDHQRYFCSKRCDCRSRAAGGDVDAARVKRSEGGCGGEGTSTFDLDTLFRQRLFQRAAGFGERDVVGAPQPADPHDVLGGLNGG